MAVTMIWQNRPGAINGAISHGTDDAMCFAAGFPWLSGLPEASRRRRILMPIQAFVDESGGKGQGHHFVMAGLASTADRWALFSNEWRACLTQGRGIRNFKMREAAVCRGEFNGWSERERDVKLCELANIINKYVEFCTLSVIDLHAHAKTWAISNNKPKNEPYFWPFHNTIMAMCFTLWDIGLRERFEIVFDEQVIFGLRARRWYPLMRAVCRHREPDAYAILPVDPIFRSDDDFLPIQAADLLAWCTRRFHDVPDERPFSWLFNEMPNVSVSEYSQYYDRIRMESVTADTRRLLREGNIPQDLLRTHREIKSQ